jgi:tRNA G18 (ribose-2'-O)-methylase SpoU
VGATVCHRLLNKEITIKNHKFLTLIYEDALTIEKTFNETTASSPEFLKLIEQLISLTHSDQFELKKLGLLAERLNNNARSTPWTHRIFLNILVPIERLLQKQITDPDFIHNLPDKKQQSLTPRNSIVLIADHIRSAFNIGAFFRTGDSFAIEKIYLTGYSSTPDHPAVKKTALGSQAYVAWEHFDNTEDAINKVKNEGFKIIALETTPQAENLYYAVLPKKIAILVGNERFGLNSSVLKKADQIIQIPMSGHKNSLNVATSFALIAYEWQRSNFIK